MPFSVEQFVRILETYNTAIWPLQLVFNGMAIVAIIIIIRKQLFTDKMVLSILSLFWLWMGIVYHLTYFSTINPGAYIFGSGFILEGILFLYAAFLQKNISFHFTANIYGWAGAVYMLFALVIYPILGYFQGLIYPYSPTFGLPCPTTIFTFGILLWADRKIPLSLLVIPIAWSLIGFSASIYLGIKEDLGLLLSCILFLIFQIAKTHLKRNFINPVPGK